MTDKDINATNTLLLKLQSSVGTDNRLPIYLPNEEDLVRRISRAMSNLEPKHITYDPEYKTNVKYRQYKQHPNFPSPTCHSLHRGQRKLFISELQLLTNYLPFWDSSAIVLYIGSSPGIHLGLFTKLFPNVKWILVDPRFVQTKNVFITKNGEDNFKIIADFFDIGMAKQYVGKVDFFISDIRITTTEELISQDMSDQLKWTRIIKPKIASMLKFRPPYSKVENETVISYMKGKIMFQMWNSLASTETRLVSTAIDIPHNMKINVNHYNDVLYELNRFIRPWVTFKLPSREHDLKNVPGFDRCHNCTLEAQIWKDYLSKKHNISNRSYGIAELMNEISTDFYQPLFVEGVFPNHRVMKPINKESPCISRHGYFRMFPAPRRLLKIANIDFPTEAETPQYYKSSEITGGYDPRYYLGLIVLLIIIVIYIGVQITHYCLPTIISVRKKKSRGTFMPEHYPTECTSLG